MLSAYYLIVFLRTTGYLENLETGCLKEETNVFHNVSVIMYDINEFCNNQMCVSCRDNSFEFFKCQHLNPHTFDMTNKLNVIGADINYNFNAYNYERIIFLGINTIHMLAFN